MRRIILRQFNLDPFSFYGRTAVAAADSRIFVKNRICRRRIVGTEVDLGQLGTALENVCFFLSVINVGLEPQVMGIKPVVHLECRSEVDEVERFQRLTIPEYSRTADIGVYLAQVERFQRFAAIEHVSVRPAAAATCLNKQILNMLEVCQAFTALEHRRVFIVAGMTEHIGLIRHDIISRGIFG